MSTEREALAGGACENTDRELWRERFGDFYANSIHVTKDGGIGINVAGHVVVMPLQKWHALAALAQPVQGESVAFFPNHIELGDHEARRKWEQSFAQPAADMSAERPEYILSSMGDRVFEGSDGYEELLESLAQPAVQGEPVAWQYRQVGTTEWQELVPNWRIDQTLEQRIEEIRGYRYEGKPCYEARALYAHPPAQPEDAVHGRCAWWLYHFTFKHKREPYPQEVWDAALAAQPAAPAKPKT